MGASAGAERAHPVLLPAAASAHHRTAAAPRAARHRGTPCPGVPVLPRGVCCACQLCKGSSGWFSYGCCQLSLFEQQCLGCPHSSQGMWQLGRRGCSVLSQQVPEAVAALEILAVHVAAKCQPRPEVGMSTNTEGPVSAQGSSAATSVATWY